MNTIPNKLIDNSEEDQCPASLDWWDSASFDEYYHLGQPNQSGWVSRTEFIHKIDCPVSLPAPSAEDNDSSYLYGTKSWKKLPIPYAWKLGQFSRNDQVQRVYRDHWHTGFTLDNYRIHIDYIDGPYGAGHVQRREYRIFLNGEEIARGGGRLGWNMAVWGNIRNFPLIVPVDSYLIYIDGFLQPFGSEYCIGHIAPNNVLSIFQEY